MKHLDIAVKKILLSGISDINHPLSATIKIIINELLTISAPPYTNYFYEKASEYIFAYLELGGSYFCHKNLFDYILRNAGISPAEINYLHTKNPPVVLKKGRIRSIIGKWPASPYNSHNISDAIDDIITHSLNQEYGTYQYYTAKKDGTYTALYLLYVYPDTILFLDVFRNRFYQLIKE